MKKKSKLYPELVETIQSLTIESISDERKKKLQPLIHYIQNKVDLRKVVYLNFICTHNSRRSHLSQIWAQAMAKYFKISKVFCYSGGTEATAMFPAVKETLDAQGFKIFTLVDGPNPAYAVRYAHGTHPIICFSKVYDHPFNPQSDFAAVMVCSDAEENCPFIATAEKRLSVTYEDPKLFDNTPEMAAKYTERSLQIATEMYYIFSSIK